MNIVVTGASNGIGYSTCLALAKTGDHKIFALSRNLEKLNQLKQEAIQKEFSGQINPVALDITDPESINNIYHEISKQVDRLDVVISNAGKLINKAFADIGIAEWKEIYAVNVFGAVELTKKLFPLLRSGKIPAHIVFISSMGGVQGTQKFRGLSAYTTSKAALISLTECMAEEFRDSNIKVNCLALGSVSTEMFSAAFPDYKAALTPGEMAEFIADFALNGRKYFNGKVLPVSSSTP